MADYSEVSLGRFTFTLREAQFAKPNERGQWRRANCKLCGAKIEIGYEELAREFLHRPNEHTCRAPAQP